MIFYLFRHGETYFSKNHVPYGEKGDLANILKEGIPAIKKIALILKKNNVNIIYSSPIKRCVQTVKIIQKEVPSIKVIYKQDLEEEKIIRNLETFSERVEKIKSTLDEIIKEKHKKIAICSHGWPITIMNAILKKEKPNKLDLHKYPKCGEIVVIDTDNI